MNRRVAVTGMGIISPVGNSVAQFWESLIQGRHGIGPITRFDISNKKARTGGGNQGFNARDYMDRRILYAATYSRITNCSRLPGSGGQRDYRHVPPETPVGFISARNRRQTDVTNELDKLRAEAPTGLSPY